MSGQIKLRAGHEDWKVETNHWCEWYAAMRYCDPSDRNEVNGAYTCGGYGQILSRVPPFFRLALAVSRLFSPLLAYGGRWFAWLSLTGFTEIALALCHDPRSNTIPDHSFFSFFIICLKLPQLLSLCHFKKFIFINFSVTMHLATKRSKLTY